MAIVEVKVPQLSESVSEATMLQWKKKPGEAVAQDEILIELETDKVVLEVPAPAAGVLAQVLQNDGDKPAAAPVAAPAPAAQPAAAAASSTAAASPAASKLMAEKGIGAGDVAGSGRDGRITKGDVLSAGSAPAAAPAKAAAKPALPEVKVPASATTWLNDRPEQRVPMSRLRARIAERLLESQQTNAILTTFNEVNMQPVMDLRAKYKDKFEKEHGVKLGFMSFFVKAAVHALKKFPLVNASIDGNDIVYHGYFDIGIAVGSPRGLVVPILRNADQLSLAEIEKKIAEFGQKAKDGKLSIEEMTGGTFSISNGGVFGSMLSTPIINPPQSAILGVHATKERPVVENGQIVIRPINYLALSYDHRIIDGREAVLSLVAMKDALEDPARLLLDL
ncbi:dihydrolipoamide succinyltransferase [Burkholderia pseudomallei]|uniref:2-oxoglutarate dehydrogenase complex dihydrolipoyllysine-residue succinyltransferase n=1 Tax=Burkholderia pseudomallei TaxID=28450 RepID=UPI000F08880B|nr:2-oxoglutarate dehydrogenase complex dihydrolipoyllysine-residue succinyltransferase [Burkholderia pseudomallei]VBV77838.1 dihydrolipoamide succinyltransferase [Burkholderia pseudomallei]